MNIHGVTLAANRVATHLFIQADPSFIVLHPSSRVKTSTGGYKEVKGTPRPVQMLSVVFQEAKGDWATTTDGGVRKHNVVLVGLHDAEVEEGDTFIWPEDESQEWVVTGVHPANGYEVKADVVAYGLGGRSG